jgi:long-subunit acyl-CoA synthetase (AMP-forming)
VSRREGWRGGLVGWGLTVDQPVIGGAGACYPAARSTRRARATGEFDQEVDRVAAGFRRLGVRQGIVVSLTLPNCPEFVIAWFALAWAR